MGTVLTEKEQKRADRNLLSTVADAPVNGTHMAVNDGERVGHVEIEIRKGANPNARAIQQKDGLKLIEERGYEGKTALEIAEARGDTAVAEMLIYHGALVRNENGTFSQHPDYSKVKEKIDAIKEVEKADNIARSVLTYGDAKIYTSETDLVKATDGNNKVIVSQAVREDIIEPLLAMSKSGEAPFKVQKGYESTTFTYEENIAKIIEANVKQYTGILEGLQTDNNNRTCSTPEELEAFNKVRENVKGQALDAAISAAVNLGYATDVDNGTKPAPNTIGEAGLGAKIQK